VAEIEGKDDGTTFSIHFVNNNGTYTLNMFEEDEILWMFDEDYDSEMFEFDKRPTIQEIVDTVNTRWHNGPCFSVTRCIEID
jgi:hypothetical protein